MYIYLYIGIHIYIHTHIDICICIACFRTAGPSIIGGLLIGADGYLDALGEQLHRGDVWSCKL